MKTGKKVAIITGCLVLGYMIGDLVGFPETDSLFTHGDISKVRRFSSSGDDSQINAVEKRLATDSEFSQTTTISMSILYTRLVKLTELIDVTKSQASDIPALSSQVEAVAALSDKVSNARAAVAAASEALSGVMSGESQSDYEQAANNAVAAFYIVQNRLSAVDDFVAAVTSMPSGSQDWAKASAVASLWSLYQADSASLMQDVERQVKWADRYNSLAGSLTDDGILELIKELDSANDGESLTARDLGDIYVASMAGDTSLSKDKDAMSTGAVARNVNPKTAALFSMEVFNSMPLVCGTCVLYANEAMQSNAVIRSMGPLQQSFATSYNSMSQVRSQIDLNFISISNAAEMNGMYSLSALHEIKSMPELQGTPVMELAAKQLSSQGELASAPVSISSQAVLQDRTNFVGAMAEVIGSHADLSSMASVIYSMTTVSGYEKMASAATMESRGTVSSQFPLFGQATMDMQAHLAATPVLEAVVVLESAPGLNLYR